MGDNLNKERQNNQLEEWWSDGLQFTCIPDCGRCCNEPDGLVFLSTKDAMNLSEFHNMEVNDWIERDCTRHRDGRIILKSNESDGICIYLLDDMSCSVYESKPIQCSAFPWWKENLKNEYTWQKIKKTCPGIDLENAPIITSNIIEKWVNADIESTKGFRKYVDKNDV